MPAWAVKKYLPSSEISDWQIIFEYEDEKAKEAQEK
jgi:hypothetical protein